MSLDLLDDELIVDSFAGGGGASTGIWLATGRHPDIAINHDAEALALHRANHPTTKHLCHSIWKVDPVAACGGRRVGLLWASPDCKHHSRAKGGKPREKGIRDLAWVVVRWARQVRPRVILLENVSEFRDWGPLTQDGRPCPERRGQEFDRWVSELRRLGYKVEWRELRACDYGAPTIRKRLFLVARCDGRPIRWPEPTHGAPTSAGVVAGLLQPWRTAAQIIDWSLPCPSIFLTREEGRTAGVNRPLAPKTMARIAKGMRRFVLDNPRPFLVGAAATFIGKSNHGDKPHYGLDGPVHTVMSGGQHHALVAAFLGKLAENGEGVSAAEPLHTVMAGAPRHYVTAAFLDRQFGASACAAADEPVGTVTAGGGGKSAIVAAFLSSYYGAAPSDSVAEPVPTIPTRDRHSVVTVEIAGEPYAVVDIGMRMLTPTELFRAQGFPEGYVIETGVDADGREIPLTRTAQIRMCGNSVVPSLAEALVKANFAPAPEKPTRVRERPAPLFAGLEVAA